MAGGSAYNLRGTYDVLENNDDDEPRPNKLAYQELGNTTHCIAADVEQGNEVDDDFNPKP